MTVRANTEAVRRYRQTPEGRERTLLAGRVRNEALRRLRLAHEGEYQRLLRQVWAERENGHAIAPTETDQNGREVQP